MIVCKPRRVLSIAVAYFLLCGGAAIVWPESWYLVCGIPRELNNPFLLMTGMLMVSIALGGLYALLRSEVRTGLITLLFACIGDALCVLVYMTQGILSLERGSIFICVDLLWIVVLVRAYLRESQRC